MKADLSLGEIAAFFGLTRSAAQRLAREGLFVQSRAGRFDLKTSAQKYVGHLREVARNRSGSESARASIRLKQSAASLNELKTKRLSAELIEMAAAMDLVRGFARSWRAAFLSLPSRLRVALHLPMTAEDQLEKVIDDALDELVEETKGVAKVDPAPLPRLTLNSKGPYTSKSGPPARGNGSGGGKRERAELR